MGFTWQRVRNKGTLYSRIADEIERLIDVRSLHPGDRLPPERELAMLLGVSRPSVREAVKTLSALGRLQVRHGRGVFIAPPDGIRGLASPGIGLRELFAMRQVLEVPAAGWAAQSAGRAEIEGLEATIAALEGTTDLEELRRLDTEFHLRIAAMAGNRFLQRTMSVLHEMLSAGMETTLKIPGRLEKSRAEHQLIAHAIATGDAGAARRAMKAHIAGAAAAAERRLRDGRSAPSATTS